MSIVFFITASLFFSCKGPKDEKHNENVNTGAQKLFAEYIKAFKQKDWASIVNMIHPADFKSVSSKDLEKKMNNSMNPEGFVIEIMDSKIDSLYPAMNYNGDAYTFVRLATKVSMMPAVSSNNSSRADYVITENFSDLLKENDDKHNYLTDCRLINGGAEYTMIDFSYGIYLAKDKKWYFLSKDDESE